MARVTNRELLRRMPPPVRVFVILALLNFAFFIGLRLYFNMGALNGYHDATGYYMNVEHSSKMVRVSERFWKVDYAHSVFTIAVHLVACGFCAWYSDECSRERPR